MQRMLIVLPAVVLLAGLVFGGAFFVYDGGNGPAPRVEAAALDAEPLEAQANTNTPLEAPAEKPAPEPEPAETKPEPKPEPKPTTQPTTDPKVEAMKDALEKALQASNLSDEEKQDRATEIANALEMLEAKLAEQQKNSVTVSGRVLDPAGLPVTGAAVIATNSQLADEALGGRRRASATRSIGTTDADGNFSGIFYAPSEASLSIDLYAQHNSFLASERQTITATPGTPYEGVTLTLKQAAGVTGRVVDQDFSAIQGARVIVLAGGGENRGRWTSRGHTVMTDENGEFTVTGLTAGDYSLSVTCIGYTPPKDWPTISITEGQPTRLSADVVMSRVTAIKLKLTCADKQPRGYFTVTFYDSDGKTRRGSGLAESDGTALVQNPPEDAIEMVIFMRGYMDSDRIRVNVYKGSHSDAGEVTLTASEEQAKEYDGVKPANGEDAKSKAEQLRKTAEKLRGSKR